MGALLEKEIDFDAHGGLFGTALQAAASQDHSEAVVILLEAKASVNLTQGRVAGTALIAAATGGNPDVITMLLKEGANINAHGGVWGTALQAAAAIGNQAAVECLLEEGADINAQGGLYGTALQAAAAKGKKDIVEVLLTGGANIKIQAGAYGTALRAAVSEGHEMIATMLLKEGKKFNKQENISPTALDTVIDIIGKAIADIRAADDTSTQMKIYADNTYAELLLEEVVNWDIKGDYFSTALQRAIITNDNEKIIAVLLEEGVGGNTRNIAFKALFEGISEENKDLMVTLLKGEMHPNCQWIFDTALCIAAMRGMEGFVAKLREKGAKFNTRHIFYTLQADSIRGIHSDAFEIFLKNGADINTQNYCIETDVEPQHRGVYIWLCLAGLILGSLSIFIS